MLTVWSRSWAQGVCDTGTLHSGSCYLSDFLYVQVKTLSHLSYAKSMIKTTLLPTPVFSSKRFWIFTAGFSSNAHILSIPGGQKDIFPLQWYAKCFWVPLLLKSWRVRHNSYLCPWVVFPAGQSCLGAAQSTGTQCIGAAAPGITGGSCAWEGCGEEEARFPWEVMAGREQLEVEFELSRLLGWLGAVRTRWRAGQ